MSWGLAAQGRARDFTLNFVAGSDFIVRTEMKLFTIWYFEIHKFRQYVSYTVLNILKLRRE